MDDFEDMEELDVAAKVPLIRAENKNICLCWLNE